MLEGIAFIAIVTALITSAFVARASREREAAAATEEASEGELIRRRLDDLERKLDVLIAAAADTRP
jgi:hypothetical protein